MSIRISSALRFLKLLGTRLYIFIFARPSMQSFNKKLFRLVIRGLGYNNVGPVEQTGEAIFIKLLAHFRPSLCVDIGANRGNYSKALLELTGTHLISFEPLPKAFADLCELEQRFPGRLQAVNKGVGNLDCELDLHYGAEDSELASFSEEINEIAYVKAGNTNVMKVTVLTLDSYFSEPRNAGIQHIDLIKIDTEGYEVEVLSGATTTLSRLKPSFIQIEYNWHQLFKQQSLYSISLLLKDYVAYQLLPHGKGLHRVDVSMPQHNIYQYSNIVFVRNEMNLQFQRLLQHSPRSK